MACHTSSVVQCQVSDNGCQATDNGCPPWRHARCTTSHNSRAERAGYTHSTIYINKSWVGGMETFREQLELVVSCPNWPTAHHLATNLSTDLSTPHHDDCRLAARWHTWRPDGTPTGTLYKPRQTRPDPASYLSPPVQTRVDLISYDPDQSTP